MKLIVSTAASLLLATQAFAGTLVYEPPVQEEVVVAEPEPVASGPNLAWIIPVIGLGAIAYAIADD